MTNAKEPKTATCLPREREEKFNAILDSWHRRTFAGNVPTEVWNLVFFAMSDLKKELRDFLMEK